MIRKELAKRISALLLTFMMTLSMSGFAFEDVFADTEETADTQQITTEESIDAEAAAPSETAPAETPDETEAPAEDALAAEELTEEAPLELAEPETEELQQEEVMAVQEPVDVTVDLVHQTSVVIKWKAAANAATYKVFQDGEEVAAVPADTLTYTFAGLTAATEYKFKVEAYDTAGAILAGSEELAVKTKRTLPAAINGASRVTNYAGELNLREIIGEAASGYSVVQGSCTDGKGYAYYMMVSASNQMGRVAKINMSDNTLVGVSGVFDVNHGNGMCYDSKRNRLVSCTYHDSRKRLFFINPDTLQAIGTKNVRFDNFANAGSDSISAADRSKGLTAISYNSTYDCYVAMESTYHDVIIYDAETLQAIGKACTKVTVDYPKVWQSMDSDDEYVYFLLSKGGSAQPNNIVLCLDWHSEKLAEMKKEGKSFIEKAWYCGSGDGRPSTVIKLGVPYEIESIYHVTNNGQNTFYLSEYYNDPTYRTVSKQESYKVKWKKVKKKVKWKKVTKKVKWKKVKTKKGKWKWKYKKKKVWKYKTKKVWTYKTKYRTVQVQEKYNAKQNYVYNLGSF